MPIQTQPYSFESYYINTFAPDRAGVYALYDGNALIYYGSSERSVRARLQSHKAGYEGGCTQRATHFNTEICANPVARERELLQEYQRGYGQLPRCNSYIP